MGADHSSFAAADLDGLAYGGDAFVRETLHFLFVMDQRPEAADGLAFGKGVLDHLDGAFDAEAKSVFVCQQNLHMYKPIRFFSRKIFYNFTRWVSYAKPPLISVDF